MTWPPGAAPPEWVGTRVEVGHEVWPPVVKETAEALSQTVPTGIRVEVVVQAGRAEIRQEVWAALRIFWDRAFSLAVVVVVPVTPGAEAMAAMAAAVAELSGPRLAAMDLIRVPLAAGVARGNGRRRPVDQVVRTRVVVEVEDLTTTRTTMVVMVDQVW